MCAPSWQKAKKSGGELILETKQEAGKEKTLHHLAEAGCERNGHESICTKLGNGNNQAGGPSLWHVPLLQAEIVESEPGTF